MNEKEPIYLDQKGYEEFLKEIESIKASIRQNNLGRREAFNSGAGDGWDSPEFEEIERTSLRLAGELSRKLEDLDRIIIVEKSNDSDVIDIGDIFTADISTCPEDVREMTLKLVGSNGQLGGKIKEVSINSPIGAATYKKRVGDTCSYSVGDRDFSVFIKEKLDLQKEEDGPVKKLTK